MASNLDLQEQEQLDELKAFWNKYGNLITWGLTLVLGAFAAVNGWDWWQRDQGAKASVMYEEFDKALQAGDADQAGRVFSDLRSRYPRSTYAQQAGLLAAKLQADKNKPEAAQESLNWVAEQATDEEFKSLAHLRLSALQLDKKAYDEALKQLEGVKSPEFASLADDRRGDILLASGKKEEAAKAYLAAYKAMDEKLDYRRVVEAKLASLGAAPEPAATASGVAK